MHLQIQRLSFIFSFLALVVLVTSQAHAFDSIKGIASITDGDTLQIHGKKIRLHGVDAPESKQSCTLNGKPYRCGQKAALALDELAGGKTLECKGRTVDRYRRIIAICYLGKLDINAWMVENGWALAYRRYSKDYVKHEQFAQDKKLGIWAGEFVAPWIYRRR